MKMLGVSLCHGHVTSIGDLLSGPTRIMVTGKHRISGLSANYRRNCTIVFLVFAVIFIFQSACSRRAEVGVPSPYETGQASWYGDKFQNKRTASGEKFDMHKCTAAHKTLPFDTVVRVENLKNGKKVDVRINDRGPFIDGRIIDLSRKAAEMLGMIRDGIVPVRIEVLN